VLSQLVGSPHSEVNIGACLVVDINDPRHIPPSEQSPPDTASRITRVKALASASNVVVIEVTILELDAGAAEGEVTAGPGAALDEGGGAGAAVGWAQV
jgi:hypothetical protein